MNSTSSLIFHHHKILEVLEKVTFIFESFRDIKPVLLLILGPTGVGKTWLIKILISSLFKSANYTKEKCLVINIPITPSPKAFYGAVLDKMDVKYSSGFASAKLEQLMVTNLQLRNIHTIIFDEFGHAAEKPVNGKARTVGDCIKDLQRKAKVNVICVGIPKAIKVWDENEQLRSRSTGTIYLMPFSWLEENEKQEFAAIIQEYEKILVDKGAEFTIGFSDFVKGCYSISGGCMRVVSEFIILIEKSIQNNPVFNEKRLSEIAELKVDRLHENLPYFTHETLSQSFLCDAYITCLSTAEINVDSYLAKLNYDWGEE